VRIATLCQFSLDLLAHSTEDESTAQPEAVRIDEEGKVIGWLVKGSEAREYFDLFNGVLSRDPPRDVEAKFLQIDGGGLAHVNSLLVPRQVVNQIRFVNNSFTERSVLLPPAYAGRAATF
jgi:hypothetical protein